MIRNLVFHTFAYDTRRIVPGTTETSFFTDNGNSSGVDVTRVPEAEILKWLMESPFKRDILKLTGLPLDMLHAYSVGKPITDPRKKPGDIDILLCNLDKPKKAVAMLCKRVKVTAIDEEEKKRQSKDKSKEKDKDERKDRVGKIGDLGDGVKQANGAIDLRFHKTYMVIIMETLGVQRKDLNVLFRGPTSDTMSGIYDFPQRGAIDPKVGIAFLTIIQPTGKDFREMGVLEICVDKEAKAQSQSSLLTEKIVKYMRDKGKK